MSISQGAVTSSSGAMLCYAGARRWTAVSGRSQDGTLDGGMALSHSSFSFVRSLRQLMVLMLHYLLTDGQIDMYGWMGRAGSRVSGEGIHSLKTGTAFCIKAS